MRQKGIDQAISHGHKHRGDIQPFEIRLPVMCMGKALRHGKQKQGC